MTHCKYCDQLIDFDDDHVSPRGIKIPIDFETSRPHNYEFKPIATLKKCHNCKENIFFDSSRINPANGKLIPYIIFLHVIIKT